MELARLGRKVITLLSRFGGSGFGLWGLRALEFRGQGFRVLET